MKKLFQINEPQLFRIEVLKLKEISTGLVTKKTGMCLGGVQDNKEGEDSAKKLTDSD